MPVQNEQFKVDPYTSTVPLVQLPVQDMYSGAKTNPNVWGGKGTSALAIGDSLLKGFMQGHQLKEQKKQAQAQATINAADSASEAAYQTYQDTLTKSGGNDKDPAAQAAYDAYKTTFMAGKQAKAQFVLPDKTQKGKKSASESASSAGTGGTGGKDKKQPHAGFNNIRDFFEANPHIVPQIALMTMQPKPPGLSSQGQQTVQSLETSRLANEEKSRKLQNEKTYQEGFSTYSHLSQEEIAALPPDAKKGYDAWQNARAAIAPTKYSGTTKEYMLSNGKKVWLHPEEANEFYPDATPVDTGGVKPGSDAEAEDKFLKEKYGVTRENATTDQLAAATQFARAAKIPNTSTSSTSTTTPQGDRTTTTTRKAAPGVITPPPAASRQAAPTSGGISKPSTAKASPTGKGEQGTGKPGSPLNTYPNPEAEPHDVSYARNKGWAKLGPYTTTLPQQEETEFRAWAAKNPDAVRGEVGPAPDFAPIPDADYDVRGHFHAAKSGDPAAKLSKNAWDGKMHGNDKFKTPYNGGFSNESMYATPDAPRWTKDGKLYTSDGKLVTDETPKKKSTSKGGITPPPQAGKAAKGGITKPPVGKKETYQDRQNARRVTDEQQKKYAEAEKAYNNALAAAQKQYQTNYASYLKAGMDDSTAKQTAQGFLDKMTQTANDELKKAKEGIANWYDQQIRLAGGTPGSDKVTADNPPPGASARVKNANGELIGYAVDGQFVPLGK